MEPAQTSAKYIVRFYGKGFMRQNGQSADDPRHYGSPFLLDLARCHQAACTAIRWRVPKHSFFCASASIGILKRASRHPRIASHKLTSQYQPAARLSALRIWNPGSLAMTALRHAAAIVSAGLI